MTLLEVAICDVISWFSTVAQPGNREQENKTRTEGPVTSLPALDVTMLLVLYREKAEYDI